MDIALFRRAAAQWPLAIALAFGIYAYVLLANAYRSHDQLKAEADQHIVADAKRQAAAVADLIAERRNDAAELAESQEVTNYLINRALGMSLRYGLSINLYAIEERLRHRLERTDLRGERIYRRIVLYDEAGRPLVDLAPREGRLTPPAGVSGKPAVTVDPDARRIVVVAPVIFKGAASGSVVTVGDLAQLSRDLIGTTADNARREFLVSGDGRELPTNASAERLDENFVRRLAALPEHSLTPIDRRAGENAMAANSLAVRTAVPGVPLSLITIHSEESLYGQITSRFFLYSASTFPLLLLAAAFMFDRMRRAEVALTRSEQRFRTIFDNIKDTIFILDIANGGFIEANPSVLGMYGYRQDELAGLTAMDVCTSEPPFGPEQWSGLLAAAANGETQYFEWRSQRKDGTLFWATVSALRAHIDGKDRLLVVVHDITKRKEQEEALFEALEHHRQLNKRLEEAQTQLLQSEKMASIGQLAAGVAHEINNPIGYINSNLGTLSRYVEDLLRLLSAYESATDALPAERGAPIASLRRELDVDYLRDDIGKLLAESQEGLQRVRRIVADLKDFSHVDQAELQYANLETGLDSTLNVVWNELKYKAEVIKEYAGVPEIECLASQLNQVFMNLLLNAAQSIAERGRIIVRTGFDDDRVWVEVEDTGAGIAAEHLSRIFEPFFTTKPVGKGTGLGLSLAYGIVRKHGGEIKVSSEQGVGTRFRVVLPRQAPAATTA